jgi:transcriptional regulator of acetoin/glycerol metabolism
VVAGRPVLDALASDLGDTGVTVVLSDEHARVVERRDPDDVARRRLDTAMLQPGFAWRVETAGTNALGIATRDCRAALVDGAAHGMAALHSLTMASAPICDPRTGQLLDTVTLVCRTDTTNVLTLPLARRAARSVEHRPPHGWSTRDHVLNEAFRRARRRARGPLALAGDGTLLMNAAAARMFSAADRSSMWEIVQRTTGSGNDSATFVSGDGASLVGEIDLRQIFRKLGIDSRVQLAGLVGATPAPPS